MLTPSQNVKLAVEKRGLQASYLSLEDPFGEVKFADILSSGLYLFLKINCG